MNYIVTYHLLPDTGDRAFWIEAISQCIAEQKAKTILERRFPNRAVEIVSVRVEDELFD